MKAYFLFCAILCLSCNSAINSKTNDIAVAAANVATVSDHELEKDTLTATNWNGVNVHYYYPELAEKKDTVSIWLIFDPAAKGRDKIKDWKSIADNQGLIWISVDDARNGKRSTDIEPLLSILKIALSSKIKKPILFYATGLSGGSRLTSALQSKLQLFDGIVLCCAAPQQADMNCTTILYTADADMNCLESYEYYQSTTTKNIILRIEKGEHEWPTTKIMSAMIELVKQKQLNKQIINTSQTDLSKATIDYEIAQQTLIGQSYFQKPIAFWKDLLSKFQASKKTVDLRLLNYTSLYSYSMVNNPQVMNDLKAFDYALSIYEWSDPNNNEWMYLRSVYYLQQKDEQNAFEYIEKAIKANFFNTERLFQNTYWKNYETDSRLTKLIRQISTNR